MGHIINLLSIAYADGSITEEEKNLICSISDNLGLTNEEFNHCLATWQETDEDILKVSMPEAEEDRIAFLKNMTLLMNLISANVRFGDIETIRNVPGVKAVFLENRYDPPEDMGDDSAEPNTSNTSTYMVGAAETWAEGYTGAGSRVAIIDTGLDTTHQSFNEDAFNYAIQQTGKNISLFTQSDLDAVKNQLNGSGAAYLSTKIPFGYNYVDENTTINHMSDTQGEHGSHVAGIAAANRFIKNGSSYNDAASTVHAVGMAPDAQLFIMKVFGSGGGAYDSDYMVAIEDAIVLGCDAVNLSLGSSAPGFTYSSSSSYQDIMTKLANPNSNTKLLVSISAGNNGPLTENLTTDLYIQDIYPLFIIKTYFVSCNIHHDRKPLIVITMTEYCIARIPSP